MPLRLRHLAPLLLLLAAIALLGWPDEPDAAEAFAARGETEQRGPDPRPSEWASTQRLFPHGSATRRPP